MCDFDFFVVKAYSSSIRSLMRVGTFERKAISSRVTYGKRFPETTHSVSIGYVDVMNIGHNEARRRVDELVSMLPPIDGVKYHIEFIVRD